MDNISLGIVIVFCGAILYVVGGFVGVLLSLLGETICKKFGLRESNAPFSIRDISVALLAIALSGGILWFIGFVANLVSSLF